MCDAARFSPNVPFVQRVVFIVNVEILHINLAAGIELPIEREEILWRFSHVLPVLAATQNPG